MKKTLLLSTVIGAFVAQTFAQGTIEFQANAANGLIQFSPAYFDYKPFPVGGDPYFGKAHVGFYVAPNGAALTAPYLFPDFNSAWTPLATVLPIQIADGKTAATILTIPPGIGTSGQPVELEVVAWTGIATSWADALAEAFSPYSGIAYGWSEMYVDGQFGRLGWSQPTGNPTTTPPGTPAHVVTGANGYQGIGMFPLIPEPSTITLGYLGVAILGICGFAKNRKQGRIQGW